ncbi:MAG: protein DpdF [Polyangiaceae bacterium]
MTDFDALAKAIAGWPSQTPFTAAPDAPGCVRRLMDAMSIAAESDAVGPGDLAALTSQVLRHERHVHGGAPSLRVPRVRPWPARSEWRAAGCECTELDGQHLLVEALDWVPDWLAAADSHPPAAAAIGYDHPDSLRRASQRVPGDGFLSIVSLESYSSPGQRQAVRAVLASRPGATILVNLPTGTGKSLVAHCPALLWTEHGGVAVVIVPTTALALDQERAVFSYALRAGILPERLAYHEGQSREEREGIRERIRSGAQRIVFTSPESFVGSLAPSVHTAARNGQLRLLAIDEAHLVSQWGAEFRPEFQALSGMRRELLRAAGESGRSLFRTLLASATLTEEDYDTLDTLFGSPGPFEHVAAAVLRPEPSCWAAQCEDEDVRRARLSDAVQNLPRPMVIYTATPEHAERYAAHLRERGVRRVRTVHGDTPGEERLRVIRAWRGDAPSGQDASRTTADVVVATSAFGLGVDQSDVRTVVHVCIPETIDRYYQEVGRGGRDGRACLSLVLWTEEDVQIAKDTNRRRIIGTDLGYERWISMFQGKEPVDASAGSFRVPLHARPPHVHEESRENRAWNVRTLALMARAGLVEFGGSPPPQRTPGEEDEAWEKRWVSEYEKFTNWATIRSKEGDLTDLVTWSTRCEESRARVKASDRDASEAMRNALDGTVDSSPSCSVASSRPARSARRRREIDVVPQPSCGGCSVCRRIGRAPFEGVAPSPPPLRSPNLSPTDTLRRLFERPVLVTTPANASRALWRRDVIRAVERLVRHGVKNVIAPRAVLDDPSVRRCFRHAPDRFVFLIDLEDIHFPPPLPTVFVLDPSPAAIVPEIAFHPRDDSAPWFVVAPADARDPSFPGARAADVRSPRMPLAHLLARI